MRHLIKGLEMRTGFWALFDQGTVSLGNFLTQMLLARNLGLGDYGVFALVYGVLFFLIGAIGSLVTYPLSVRGASANPRELRRLAGTSLWFDIGLVFPEALIVLCAVAVLHRMDLFLFALLALVFWQFQETLRRALMARLDYRDAAWGDSLSYLGQATAIGVLARMGALTLESALLAVAATSAAAALVQVFQVKPKTGALAEARALAAEYWRLGGWASSTNLAAGATQQLFPWALGLLFGVTEAGSFQAIVNPLKVFNPVIVGTQNLLVPAAAKEQHERGARSASRRGLTYAAGGLLLLLPYLVVLAIWPRAVLSLLYGTHSPYVHLELALRVCVFAFAIGYWAEIAGSLLNGLGLPKTGFLAQSGATVAAIVIGVPLTFEFGLTGALASLGICALVRAGVGLYAVRANSRDEGTRTLVDGAAL
jgi:O-antigen/teichoic acid export membrane protein